MTRNFEKLASIDESMKQGEFHKCKEGKLFLSIRVCVSPKRKKPLIDYTFHKVVTEKSLVVGTYLSLTKQNENKSGVKSIYVE